TVPVVVPPGSDLYVAQRGDSIPSIARKYLKRTKYLTSTDLAEAIRAANHDRQGVFVKSGEQIIIPGILEAPIVEKTVQVASDFEVRAIYLTGVMAGSEHGERIIRHWKEVGGNAVVFDIKDSDGIVNIAFAKFVAQSGVDEVQFDYVRFPAEGDQKDAAFAYQADHPTDSVVTGLRP